jgi:hypothetical protein
MRRFMKLLCKILEEGPCLANSVQSALTDEALKNSSVVSPTTGAAQDNISVLCLFLTQSFSFFVDNRDFK